MALKLCLLGNNGSPHIQKWVQALSLQPGISLNVITFDTGIKFPGVNYFFLKKITGSKLDYVFNIPLLIKQLRKILPDVLHAHYSTSYGFMAACSGFHPLVITGWGADVFDSPKNFLMRNMLRYSLRKADALTVLTRITRTEVGRYSEKPVTLVPFGVDTNKYFPVSEKKQNETIRIGTIRTLSPKYGLEFLLRAMGTLAPKFPSLRLSIIGDGPQRVFLEDMCKDLNLKERVIFHGYINQHSEFENYYSLLSSFEIFVIPSVMDSETFGVAAVEASSCGLPVVASRVGGLPEVVQDGKTGLLVEPGNPVELARAIESLLNDPEKRNQMGINGRNFVIQNYNWENNVQQMLNVYQSVLK